MTDTAITPPAAAGSDTGTGDGPVSPPCVNDPANPACARRMIAVSQLAAHPGNVREDLALSEQFCASVASNGVRVPLLITPDADGGFRVIEGHRRLAAAVKAGLAEVPYDLDRDRAADEAGQFLDMVTANSAAYRRNYTPLEEATALFSAHEAGATRARIRKATGRKLPEVTTALAAGGLSGGTREQVTGLDRQLTLDELALLAEFEQDTDAMQQLLRAVSHRYPLEHVAERIRHDRAETAEHERIRADLEAAGCPVTDAIVPGSSLLTSLAHDGADLTADTHRNCPGHGAFFRTHDRRTPVFYCTDPAAHGHTSRWAAPSPALTPSPNAATADEDDPDGTPQPDGSVGYPAPAPVPEPTPDPAAEQARRLVIEGNRAWAAASEVRKRWVAQLLWRRTAPKELSRFIAGQLLTMPDVLRRGLPAAAGRLMFTELAGKPLEAVLRDCQTYPLARVPLLMLTPIAVAYESEMAGDGDRRSTWRTDRWAPCSRKDAGHWLRFLASLGYQLSVIEQAVADGQPYTGDNTPAEPHDTTGGPPDDETADAADPGTGQAGNHAAAAADEPSPGAEPGEPGEHAGEAA